MWTSRADGTDAKRIGRGTMPHWAPVGPWVLSLRLQSGGDELDAINADTGEVRTARVSTTIASATWAPDGSKIAFAVDDRTIRVLNLVSGVVTTAWDAAADTTSTRRPDWFHGNLSWSPDGTRILFGVEDIIETPEPGGATGITQSADVFTVAATGGRRVRLTGGPPGDGEPYEGQFGAIPVGYWPDGSRIFFVSGADHISEMNADGSCEQAFPIAARMPVWPPGAGPGLGPLQCADLGVRIDPRPKLLLEHETPVHVTVWNDGNLTATPHVVVPLPLGVVATGSSAGCNLGDGALVDCALPPLAPQTVTLFDLTLKGWKSGSFFITARVLQAQNDPLANNDARGYVDVLPCTILGTNGPDVLKGGFLPEHICGLRGNDRIAVGSNSATILAGPGNDTVIANDGLADIIDCGPGRDTAIVDQRDKVKNCERVVRREPPDPFQLEPSPHPERMRWTDATPAASPRGDRIAFWRQARGSRRWSLLVAARSGRVLRTLATTTGAEKMGWSPDGRWIAYGNGELYVVAVSGGKPKRLTHEVSTGDDSVSFVRWRDAHTIDYDVYTCCADHIPYDYVGTVTIDSKRVPRPDYTDDCVLNADCTYSPDGRFVAIVRADGTVFVDAPGGGHSLGPGCCVGWLPNSRRLVMFGGDPKARDITVVDADGGNPHVLTAQSGATNFAVSPDGAQVAFVAPAGGVPQLWVVGVDGSPPRQVMSAAPGFGQARVSWSPHGRWLLYTGRPSNGVLELDVVRPDGTARHRLVRWNVHDPTNTFLADEFRSLAWSGPQDELAVYSDRPSPGCGTADALWTVTVASGKARRFTAPCRPR